MAEHSILAPSSAARCVQCPASVTVERNYPGTDHEEAAAGTAAHWAGAELLSGQLVAVGQVAGNGVVLTDEMIDAAEVYAWDIIDTLRKAGLTPAQGWIEKPVQIPRVHPECWGTPDFWISFVSGVLHIWAWDFKFGHRVVDVYQNWQLIAYVAGVLGLHPQYDERSVRVMARVVQPRAYSREGPVQTWEFTAADIRAHINKYSNAAHEALGPEPRFNSGPECRDCRARAACPTFRRSGWNAVDESSRDQPFDLPPESLAAELRVVRAAQQRLDAREIALAEQAAALIKNGTMVPGWALDSGGGRLRWAKPVQSVLLAGRLAGVDLAAPPDVITPTQAAARGFPLDHYREWTTSTRGKPVLVPDDSTAVARVFGSVRSGP